jgi:hypothetical protein
LRDTLLRTFFFGALDGLRPETPALWGHMTAQQMVEHLTWTFEVSTGRVLLECPYPEDQREKMKPFLHHNRPTPREFMNPALRDGLPALRYPDLKSASAPDDRWTASWSSPARGRTPGTRTRSSGRPASRNGRARISSTGAIT